MLLVFLVVTFIRISSNVSVKEFSQLVNITDVVTKIRYIGF